ncbi:unnamed protein product [Meganyctiphanes norvegica]|uniref:Deformed epidermal autoregulatory factor 1 n=1 Tax=Meganyctiphanes norvegica TaxID=48144 RepID=A0AAV2RED4_MEGNR
MAEDFSKSSLASPDGGHRIVLKLNEGSGGGIGLPRQHSVPLVKILCGQTTQGPGTTTTTDQLCHRDIVNTTTINAITQANSDDSTSAPDISIHATSSAIKSEETLIITSDLSQSGNLLLKETSDLPLSTAVETDDIPLSVTVHRPIIQASFCKQEESSVLNLESGWQKAAEDHIIEVQCKDIKGTLIKARFGSGNRGRCIITDKTWFTPQEFQEFTGLSACKDWKKSIKFQGEPILVLIDGGFLLPHHHSCTCSVCGDDIQPDLSSSKDLLISQFTEPVKGPPTIITKLHHETKKPPIIVNKEHPEWIKAAESPVLDVRCKKVKGQLVKARFGSGTRGRSIIYEKRWWTPAEFEAAAGRSASKDWKRSIKFHGESLLVLIERGYLKVHASSCSCTACLDDDVSSGIIRLFHPYKRKRRENRSHLDDSGSTLDEVKTKILKQEPQNSVATVTLPVSELSGLTVVPNLVLNSGVGHGATVVTTTNTQISTHGSSTAVEASGQLSPREATPTSCDEPQPSDDSLEKLPIDLAWEKMNEVLTGLEQQVAVARVMFEQLRQQSKEEAVAASQNKILVNDKIQVLPQDKLETQNNERFLVEVNEIREEDGNQSIQPIMLDSLISNVPQLEPAVHIHGIKKKCVNCNRESDLDCSGCRNRAYCGYFCQRRDWADHQSECGRSSLPPEDSLNATSNVPGYIFMLSD